MEFQKETLTRLLAGSDEAFEPVRREADRVRRALSGDRVRIRGIIEFSNYCGRSCRYCGLRRENGKLVRYRMRDREILETAEAAGDAGYKTIVLQSGEDPYYTAERLSALVRPLKAMGLAVTLSCGERSREDYLKLREAGADRYLLKHETADPFLYGSLHPCGTLENRIGCLRTIKELGYETGSGFMTGLPGQTAESLAEDLLLLKELSCDMAGIGPFLPHPETPLGDRPAGSGRVTRRAVALARILLPRCRLPATTALEVLEPEEKWDLFSWGADVIMRKLTPEAYRKHYEIYPSSLRRAGIRAERVAMEEQLRRIGRIPD